MRVLIVGSQNPWRMEVATKLALERAGHTVAIFDDRRSARLVGHRLTQWRARRTAASFNPDFVLLSKCLRLSAETVSRVIRGRPNVLWYHDAPWFREPGRWDVRHVIDIGRLTDVFFVSGFVEEWRKLGVNAQFLPSAAAMEIVPQPLDENLRCTVAFVGTGYDEPRAEFLMDLSRHTDVRVYGPGWETWAAALRWNGGEIRGREYAKACSSALLTLGILPTLADGATTYASDRMWMTVLAGGTYLGPWSPGIESLMHDGVHCFWYRDRNHCRDLVLQLAREPDRVAAVRRAGETFVRQHHTHDARVPNLLHRTAWVNPLDSAAL